MCKKAGPSSLNLLPEKVRNSRLITALAGAARQDRTSGFDYLARLEDLSRTIAPQLEWIKGGQQIARTPSTRECIRSGLP
jgi:hypothetical protein